jgi:phage terminase small subunit
MSKIETIRPPGPSPEAVLAADAARLDAFVREFVATGSAVRAYRLAWELPDAPLRSLWPLANYMLQRPDVIERVRVVRAESEQRALIGVVDALRHQVSIALADPREIVWTTLHACRYCWGVGGAYQWRDENEYVLALAGAIDAQTAQPSEAGSYGYTIHREPNGACETCAGAGETRTHIADLRSIEGPAAKLIKSVKTDRFGVTTIELHDQLKAWDQVNRMIAAYRDSLSVTAAKPPELPANATPEQAREHYLAMIQGGPPAA